MDRNNASNILIRLPNWLGDMVMSTSFVKAVKDTFPHASVDLIAKKGIDFLLDYFPGHHQHFLFDKKNYNGLKGVYRFGKEIGRQKKYDIFFCLPNSFSSAVMGWSSGATIRVGYKKELRSWMLTHSCQKKEGSHRVEEYIDLLRQFTGKEIEAPAVTLNAPVIKKGISVIVNINSEADSRRLPKEKAIAAIEALRKRIPAELILIGSPKEKEFVDSVYNALVTKENVRNLAGQTSLPQLIELLASAAVMLTTDSGPAHVANALGTHTVVLFGAGNERNTSPFNKEANTVIRLGQLPCEPCVSNICKQYGVPKCLLLLDEEKIVSEVAQIWNLKKDH